MSFIYSSHQGLPYGDGYLQGEGQIGQVVRLIGNDLFEVNTDATVRSFGILRKDYAHGDQPGIFCNGGILMTDVFEGTPSAGDLLKAAGSGFLTPVSEDGEHAVAQVISLQGGILKIKLLV